MAKAKSGKKYSFSPGSSQCGQRFRETNPKAVSPPGSFAPTSEYPISQRKRMAGIN